MELTLLWESIIANRNDAERNPIEITHDKFDKTVICTSFFKKKEHFHPAGDNWAALLQKAPQGR